MVRWRSGSCIILKNTHAFEWLFEIKLIASGTNVPLSAVADGA